MTWKTWGRHIPVTEMSGNLDQTGKKENYIKYLTEGISEIALSVTAK